MKRILAFALPLAMLFATQSCEKRQVASTHNMQWDNTGNDSIVRVQGQDENGNMMTYFLAYTLFNNLFSRGGYTAVNNYYQHNRASVDRNYGVYHQNYTNTTSPKSAIKLTKDTHGNVNTSNAYRKSSPTYAKKQPQTSTTYRKSSPTYNKPTTTYRTSSPTYKSSAPSSTSYRASSPTYKSSSSSSSSSYRSSSPSYRSSSSSSSSYRSSSPSYRSSSSSSYSSSSRSSSSPGRR